MLTKTEAIVLRTVKYGDQKMIVDMLTEEFGRLSFAVRPSTSESARKAEKTVLPAHDDACRRP